MGKPPEMDHLVRLKHDTYNSHRTDTTKHYKKHKDTDIAEYHGEIKIHALKKNQNK